MFKVINNIARFAITSLFYFELNLKPRKYNKEYISISSIFCIIC